MNLAQLSIGSRGEVVHVEGVDEISLRLMEMGLVPGTEFTLLGAAPLGDPLELDVRGYRPHEVPLEEFMKSGGSAKCLTLALD